MRRLLFAVAVLCACAPAAGADTLRPGLLVTALSTPVQQGAQAIELGRGAAITARELAVGADMRAAWIDGVGRDFAGRMNAARTYVRFSGFLRADVEGRHVLHIVLANIPGGRGNMTCGSSVGVGTGETRVSSPAQWVDLPRPDSETTVSVPMTLAAGFHEVAADVFCVPKQAGGRPGYVGMQASRPQLRLLLTRPGETGATAARDDELVHHPAALPQTATRRTLGMASTRTEAARGAADALQSGWRIEAYPVPRRLTRPIRSMSDPALAATVSPGTVAREAFRFPDPSRVPYHSYENQGVPSSAEGRLLRFTGLFLAESAGRHVIAISLRKPKPTHYGEEWSACRVTARVAGRAVPIQHGDVRVARLSLFSANTSNVPSLPGYGYPAIVVFEAEAEQAIPIQFEVACFDDFVSSFDFNAELEFFVQTPADGAMRPLTASDLGVLP